MREVLHGVWLGGAFTGVLRQRGDHVSFALHPSYTEDPDRPVLGLLFEQDLTRVHSAPLQLPAWFSNLLPEGVQRGWIAHQRGVSEQREMELLAQVGLDLPGAVTVRSLPPGAFADLASDPPTIGAPEPVASVVDDPRGRFSLAGVQLKLSLVAAGDRLVLPLGGVRGDWIVKFPDAALPHLPVVEHLTMQVARRVGIEVPSIKLLHRDEVPETPSTLWAAGEELAFGIERFDRAPDRTSIHIEDFAQVRGVWPSQKYDGRYEVLAALTHRGHDWDSLRELVRRLIFNVLVDNSDAHLKNFSLIYRDPRRPVLAPAYDIVSVAPYDGYGGEMALSLGGNRRPARMRVADFGRLARGTDVSAEELVDVAALVVRSVEEAWEAALDEHPVELPASVSAMGEVIAERVRSLVG